MVRQKASDWHHVPTASPTLSLIDILPFFPNSIHSFPTLSFLLNYSELFNLQSTIFTFLLSQLFQSTSHRRLYLCLPTNAFQWKAQVEAFPFHRKLIKRLLLHTMGTGFLQFCFHRSRAISILVMCRVGCAISSQRCFLLLTLIKIRNHRCIHVEICLFWFCSRFL